jgi:hypothetical protein
MAMQDPTPVLGTRAVERPALPGQMQTCEGCGEKIKFQARHRRKIIICNVYEDGHWDRLENFHPACYLQAGSPHGPVDRSQSNKLPNKR